MISKEEAAKQFANEFFPYPEGVTDLTKKQSLLERAFLMGSEWEAKHGYTAQALKAVREVLEFYAGNFDGREGTRWNGQDLLFIESKFGSCEEAQDNGKMAKQALVILMKLKTTGK